MCLLTYSFLGWWWWLPFAWLTSLMGNGWCHRERSPDFPGDDLEMGSTTGGDKNTQINWANHNSGKLDLHAMITKNSMKKTLSKLWWILPRVFWIWYTYSDQNLCYLEKAHRPVGWKLSFYNTVKINCTKCTYTYYRTSEFLRYPWGRKNITTNFGKFLKALCKT